MPQNPYLPPQTPIDAEAGVGSWAPSERPGRPLAVVAFQVLLVFLCALSLLKSVRLGVWIAAHHGESRYETDAAMRLAWSISCSFATAGTAFVIHKAMRYARYLGWFMFAVLLGLAQIDASDGVPAQFSATPAMRGGYEAAGGLWEILLVIWALRFGLSAKAKRYFGAMSAEPR